MLLVTRSFQDALNAQGWVNSEQNVPSVRNAPDWSFIQLIFFATKQLEMESDSMKPYSYEVDAEATRL